MAKISDLSDVQLRYAIAKYKKDLAAGEEGDQQNKLKIMLRQLELEQARRGGGVEEVASTAGTGPGGKAGNAKAAPKGTKPATGKPGPAAGGGKAPPAGKNQAGKPTKPAKGKPAGSGKEVAMRVPLWVANLVLGSGAALALLGLGLGVDSLYFYAFPRSNWLWMILLPIGLGVSWYSFLLYESKERIIGHDHKAIEI